MSRPTAGAAFSQAIPFDKNQSRFNDRAVPSPPDNFFFFFSRPLERKCQVVLISHCFRRVETSKKSFVFPPSAHLTSCNLNYLSIKNAKIHKCP